jgi:hypothetical protein
MSSLSKLRAKQSPATFAVGALYSMGWADKGPATPLGPLSIPEGADLAFGQKTIGND